MVFFRSLPFLLDEKLKKKKKKKKKKKEDSEGEEDEWVESSTNKSQATTTDGGAVGKEKAAGVQQREDWMELGLLSTYSRSDNLSKKVGSGHRSFLQN
jgi:hypothetical protein